MLDIGLSVLASGPVTLVLGSGAANYHELGTPRLRQELLRALSSITDSVDLRRNTLRFANKEPDACSFDELLCIYRQVYGGDPHRMLKQHGLVAKEAVQGVSPLTYELIAHLVASGVVHSIISFNFDELLERALDDEIGPGTYDWIHGSDLFQRWRLTTRDPSQRRVIVLKPHGTMSYPLSICPDDGYRQRFDTDTEAVISAELELSSSLWLLGFSSPDPDFQRVLKDVSLRKPLAIWWIDIDPQFPSANPAYVFLSERAKRRPVFVQEQADSFLRHITRRLSADDPFTCTPITRHELRCLLFETGFLRTLPQLFRFEVMVNAFKVKQQFSIEDLASCARLDDLATRLTSRGDLVKDSLDWLVEQGLLKRTIGVTNADTYYVPASAGSEAEMLARALGLPGESSLAPDVVRLVRELDDSFGFDFASVAPENLYRFQFRDPEVLKTYSDLKRRTLTVLQSASERLNVISETGDWLTRPDYHDSLMTAARRGVCIRLVLSETGPSDEKYRVLDAERVHYLQELFSSEDGSLEILRLPWEDHDVHMTANESGQSIYFRRRYSATSFVPVYLSDRQDCDFVSSQFDQFYARARTYGKREMTPLR